MRRQRIRVLAVFLLLCSLMVSALTGCGMGSRGSSSAGGEAGGSQGAEAYYAGKTIEIIVPFEEGGGTDTFFRFLVPYLEKHIPGSPKVVIKNMPGGESITGANWFHQNARKDGTVLLGTSASTVFPYLLGRHEVQYDFSRYEPVLVSAVGGVMYTSPSTGIQKPADLRNPATELVYGGISATGLDLVPLLAFELLELTPKVVMGFEGRGPARLAFERGETNIDYQTSPAYIANVKPLVDEGKAIPLMTFGVMNRPGQLDRDPLLQDIPTVQEVYQEMFGKEPTGPLWTAYLAFAAAGFSYQKALWAPEGTPQQALDALAEGVQAMAADPDFQSKAQEAVGGYPIYTGKQIGDAVRQALSIPNDVREYVRNLLQNKYSVDFE